jgi:hypothetical protein
MPGESKTGMQCAEFDALLNDALDGTLAGPKLESFQAHGRACNICGPLLAEADAGRRWLKSLAEVEPPAHLVHNILLATTGRETQAVVGAKAEGPWLDAIKAWLRSAFMPILAVTRQPRFAMSFGMAFFSLSISLSLAGVKITDLRHLDLRPTAIRRAYYETTGRVVKYYENMRLVYEVESRVREFKRATTPAEPGPQEEKKKEPRNNNTSGQPEQRQERNYSQGENQPVLAGLPNDPPVVTMATYRRYV